MAAALTRKVLLPAALAAVVGFSLSGCAEEDAVGEASDGEAELVPTPAPPACGETCACPEVGDDVFEMTLPAHEGKTIKVPPPPTQLSSYSYATNEAMVAIPAACKKEFASRLPTFVQTDDRQPGGPTGQVYARISDIVGGYAALEMMLKNCAFGLVVALHGTGGPGWDTASSAVMFSGMGFLTVLPDSQAMPDSYGLKGRLPHKKVEEIDTSNSCGEYKNYNGSCHGFNKPYCYSTKVDNIVANPDKYRKYTQRLYTVRKMELDYFVANDGKKLLEAARKVFLFGNSEGGITAVRYHNAALDAYLSGRIIYSAACNFNYFMPCADAAKVCGHQCRKDVPQLNLMGDEDGYFGRVDSVSSKVAASAFGGPITGNCKADYDAYGFERATVVEIKGAGHGALYWNDNVMRGVFADFVHSPTKSASEWPSLKVDSCKSVDGVYRCEQATPTTCDLATYEVHENATYEMAGVPPERGCGDSCVCPTDWDADAPFDNEIHEQEYEMYLPYHKKTITIPAAKYKKTTGQNGNAMRDFVKLDDFKYATDNAMVAFPKKCAEDFASEITGTLQFKDRQPGGEQDMAYGRISQLGDTTKKAYGVLNDMLEQCTCGLVLSAHGTGGPGWDTVASAGMMASFGFLVVMLDSQAMPDAYGLKGKLPLKPVADIKVDNFCGGFSGHEGSCSGFNKPFCYSSKVENIKANPNKYRAYAARILAIRGYEFDSFIDEVGIPMINLAQKVFLFGNSEGGMFVNSYYHVALDRKLSGRIIYAATCDFNYFGACAAAAETCGGECDKDVPQLNIIGDKDGYFGRHAASLSSKLASDPVLGYGGPITGNCRAAYDAHGFTTATVVEVKEAGHGILYWADNLLRGVLRDFLSSPQSLPTKWSALDGCVVENNVYRCDIETPQACNVSTYEVSDPAPQVLQVKEAGEPDGASWCLDRRLSVFPFV